MGVVVVVREDYEAGRGHAMARTLAGDAVDVGEDVAEGGFHEGIGVDFGATGFCKSTVHERGE